MTTPCRLSAAAYSIYSQLTSIAGGRSPIRNPKARHAVRSGKPPNMRKRPLGRPRRRWVDNIRIDLGEVGWGDVDWIGLAKDSNRSRALVNSVLNFRVP
jgi:hypothetical protein